MGVAATVAKKKTGPKPSAEGPREDLIAVKCRRAFKEWVVAYAKRRRVTPSILVELALEKLAESDGMEPPPER